MSQTTFQLSTIVSVDPQTAFQFLSDFNNYRYLHPYFEKAALVGSGTTAEEYSYQDFMITERPYLAFFRYQITFPTRLIIIGEQEFKSEVQAALNTKLVNVMRCVAENGRTQITETVTIHAPWLTIAYVKRQAFKAHSQTFAQLPSHLNNLP